MSTLNTTNLKNASAVVNNIVLDGSGNANAAANVNVAGNISVTGSLIPSSSFLRNRIINGDMRIDQRNAGASVTVNNTSSFYPVDRMFATGQTADGVFTIQQSSTAPTGFKNSLVATVTTADSSIGASQLYVIGQRIEGFNIADLGWGAAGALSVTFSFWARSSLTGTFGGALTNETGYSYPFTYVINAANTFEQKTITITGPTAGTWLATNGIGLAVIFSLGCGSTLAGAAGSWAASVYYGATGQTQVISTNGATFYITGVQLEVGSVATPFERRHYGQELQLCQRYCYKTTVGNGTYGYFPGSGACDSTTTAQVVVQFPVPMRSYAANLSLTTTGTSSHYSLYVAGSIRALSAGPTLGASQSTGDSCQMSCTVGSAVLVAGQAAQLLGTVANSPYLLFTAEL